MSKLECKHGSLNNPCQNTTVLADLFQTFNGIEISEESRALARHYANLGMNIRLGKNPVNSQDTEAFCTGVVDCVGRDDKFFT